MDGDSGRARRQSTGRLSRYATCSDADLRCQRPELQNQSVPVLRFERGSTGRHEEHGRREGLRQWLSVAASMRESGFTSRVLTEADCNAVKENHPNALLL